MRSFGCRLFLRLHVLDRCSISSCKSALLSWQGAGGRLGRYPSYPYPLNMTVLRSAWDLQRITSMWAVIYNLTRTAWQMMHLLNSTKNIIEIHTGDWNLDFGWRCLATHTPDIFLKNVLISFLTDIIERPVAGVFGSSVCLSLSWIHLLTKKAFRGMRSLGFTWNVWPINCLPFKFILLRTKSIFCKTNTYNDE